MTPAEVVAWLDGIKSPKPFEDSARTLLRTGLAAVYHVLPRRVTRPIDDFKNTIKSRL